MKTPRGIYLLILFSWTLFLSNSKAAAAGGKPCPDPSNICSTDAKCEFDISVGSLACKCLPGFTGDGVTCHDLTVISTITSPSTTTITKITTKTTASSTTFTKPPSTNPTTSTGGKLCPDPSNICSTDAACGFDFSLGSLACVCLPGFTGDGITCHDLSVDLCDSSPCQGHKAICTSSLGNFTCKCPNGLKGDGLKSCSDGKPCPDVSNVCSAKAKCEFNVTLMSLECKCLPGFSGNGETCSKEGATVITTITSPSTTTITKITTAIPTTTASTPTTTTTTPTTTTTTPTATASPTTFTTPPSTNPTTSTGNAEKCQTVINKIASRDSRTAVVQLVGILSGQRLELPIGTFFYSFPHKNDTCDTLINVMDPKVRQRLVFQADYKVPCGQAMANFTKRVILSTAQQHFVQIKELCGKYCSPTSTKRPIISCIRDSLRIQWPTDLTYGRDADVRPDVLSALSQRLSWTGVSSLSLVIISKAQPIVYPVRDSVTAVLSPYCADNTTYNPQNHQCQ